MRVPPTHDLTLHVPELPLVIQALLGLRLASTTGSWPPTDDGQDAATKRRGHTAGSHAFRVSRQALRDLLSDQVQGRVRPQDWVLASSPQGKPQVLGPVPGFAVSIAYAGSLCAVVAAWNGRSVGVDLEPLPCRLENDLPEHLLTPSEIALIGDDPEMFVTIWTLKEALAKESGTGLSGDMTRLDTTPYAVSALGQAQQRPDGGAAFHGRFRHSGQAYALALTLGAPPAASPRR